MKNYTKKMSVLMSALFFSIGIAQAAEKIPTISEPAVGITTYTVTFNNNSDDGYILAYPALGKTLSSGAIKCCASSVDPTTCLNHGPWYKGSVSPHKSITLICPTTESASPHTLRVFSPSRFFSLETCSVFRNKSGNNQVNSSTCHIF